MTIIRAKILLFTALFALMAGSAIAQNYSTFSDPFVGYSFDISDEWTMVAKPSATNANVEYVHRFRNEGYFTIRKIAVKSDYILSDVIENEAQSLRFKDGYVSSKQENFLGRLKGTVFNFEYVQAGKPMVGRYYFLKADPTTVYVLRFTGLSDHMRSLRTQSDAIARSFEIK